LVVQYHQKIAGFITCKVNEPQHYGVIELVAVHPSFQGLGIGSSLVKAALNWFSERVNKVYVGAHITNIATLRLYQSTGFELLKSDATFHRWLKIRHYRN